MSRAHRLYSPLPLDSHEVPLTEYNPVHSTQGNGSSHACGYPGNPSPIAPRQALPRKKQQDGLLDAVDFPGNRRLLQFLDDIILEDGDDDMARVIDSSRILTTEKSFSEVDKTQHSHCRAMRTK